MTLAAGSAVPEISLTSTSGDTVRLNELDRAIIYFYPKDHTPGCTVQACGFRDAHQEIAARGWAVYGISADGIKTHTGFIEKHSLGFTLLSDPERHAAEAFCIRVNRTMFGRSFPTTKRSTFAIENGTIVHVWEKASPTQNASQVLSWIETREASVGAERF